VSEKRKSALNADQITEYLQDVVKKIRTEEDPLLLNQYRRLFRSSVPLTLRSYLAAYLLKQIDDGAFPGSFGSALRTGRSFRDKRDRSDRSDRSERSDRGNRGEKAPRADKGARAEKTERASRERPSTENRPVERVVLPEELATTLFVSIGRNRRVFPRDLIGLIMQNVEIDRDHIGDIRVLDNYSFVQVITEDADRVIEGLHEMEYRGRKLVVSYSKKKEESAEQETDEYTEADSSTDDSFAQDDYSEQDTYLSDGESDTPDNEEDQSSV